MHTSVTETTHTKVLEVGSRLKKENLVLKVLAQAKKGKLANQIAPSHLKNHLHPRESTKRKVRYKRANLAKKIIKK
jgi:hypothetical protein